MYFLPSTDVTTKVLHYFDDMIKSTHQAPGLLALCLRHRASVAQLVSEYPSVALHVFIDTAFARFVSFSVFVSALECWPVLVH